MQDKKIILIIFLICITLITILISFIAAILYLYQRRQNAFLAELEVIRGTYEKELLKSQLEIQEQTFQYISQEIHDNIGQFISLAKLQLNTIVVDNKEMVVEKITNSTDLLTSALNDLRDLSKSLSTEMIKDTGLERAIELQINQLRKTKNYAIVFEIEGNYDYFDEHNEIIIFRILQEAVNNIIRHADASDVTIILSCANDQLTLHIRDNGKGFDTSMIGDYRTKDLTSGFGNMMKRAKLINADLKFDSAPGKGTTVTITVPK